MEYRHLQDSIQFFGGIEAYLKIAGQLRYGFLLHRKNGRLAYVPVEILREPPPGDRLASGSHPTHTG